MITVPPRHYCVIENPVQRAADGAVVIDKSGQAKLQHADLDIRGAQDPFPLYPGEALKQAVTPLTVVVANSALRLRAVLDFTDDEGAARVAGDEWLFEGPGKHRHFWRFALTLSFCMLNWFEEKHFAVLNSIEVCSCGSNWQWVSIDLGNGLVPDRQWGINQTSDGLVFRC